MTDEELLNKIQNVADEASKNYIRPALLTLIYRDKKDDGSEVALVLGSDMPLMIYRCFDVTADGQITEITDIQKAVEYSRKYNTEVKPALKLVPPATEETPEYEIMLENKLEDRPGAIEVKLKSSNGRDLTMIEIYRYFDYVSKVFFVSCISTSFGGQYLFSVTPDSKHIKLVLGNNEEIRTRVNMIEELLRARLLPSYQTIEAASQLLSGKVKANVKLNNNEGKSEEFESTFCYDDPETQTRFGFFAKKEDPKQGIIMVVDIFNNNQLILSNNWTEEQKTAIEKIRAMMKDNQEEFQKHAVSFFADDLDFRYNAFKAGKLKREEAPATAPTEQK